MARKEKKGRSKNLTFPLPYQGSLNTIIITKIQLPAPRVTTPNGCELTCQFSEVVFRKSIKPTGRLC